MHDKGPLLVFAGAGSGKTRVITARIARLIADGVAEPENILAVTFTRKAAGEMKERIAEMLSQSSKHKFRSRLPYIGTFHSFGAFVLRRHGERVGLPQAFSIYDQEDSVRLIKEIMDELNIDKKQFNPSNIKNRISSAKNEMIFPDEFVKFVQGPFDEIVSDVYEKYEEQLRDQGSADFDDLQILPLRLFEENEDVLKKYHDQYKHILVDEYQDTNIVQYNLVKKLCGDDKNICVVGDDDQGIYSWRGATIKNILSFERDFRGAKVVKLEKNYRSTSNILQAAYTVVSNNNERAEKELWTDAGSGEKIVLYEAQSDRDEARYVADIVEDLRRDSVSLDDVSILYRTNAQSRVLEEELLRRAIPYRLVGGVKFYERREIKDMIAYLRFLANPLDELSFLRIVNVPPRKIGEKSLEELQDFADEFSDGEYGVGVILLFLYGLAGEIKNWDKFLPGVDVKDEILKKLESPEAVEFREKFGSLISLFGGLYETATKVGVRALIDEILDATKYLTWIDDGTPQAQSRKENIHELKVVADKYSKLGPKDSLLEFLSDVALVEQEKESEDVEGGNSEAITLMTLHAAKGLEFDTVFMTGMEEGLMPHSLSLSSPSELEEERRLCYVGITRAKKRLHMSFAGTRNTYGGISDRVPSRFLGEIPENLMEVASWR